MSRLTDRRLLLSLGMLACGGSCFVAAALLASGLLGASTATPAPLKSPVTFLGRKTVTTGFIGSTQPIILPTLKATPEPTAVPFAGVITETEFDQKLADCRTYPNGSVHRVKETERFFFSLPKDLFPDRLNDFDFRTVTGNAGAGWISNAGPPGYAFRAIAGCWSWYYEFTGKGTTVLSAVSPVAGAPAYDVRFCVEPPVGQVINDDSLPAGDPCPPPPTVPAKQ